MKILMTILLMLPLTQALATLSKIENESQLSTIQTGGNTNVESYNLTTLSKFNYEKYIFSAGGHYFLGLFETTDDNGDTVKAESARNWDINIKTERNLNDRLNLFGGIQVEGDEFSGFTQRDNYDLGTKYKIVNTDKEKFSAEVGYRYTVERLLQANKDDETILYNNKGRLFLEYIRKVSEVLSYKTWIEYLPNFTVEEDYMITFEPSLSVVLNGTFSLKLSYKGIYDNAPAIEGNKYLDYQYTTTLIAKF